MSTILDPLVVLEAQLAALHRLPEYTDAQFEREQKLTDEYSDLKDDLGLCYTPGCRTAVDRYAHCPAHRDTTQDEDD